MNIYVVFVQSLSHVWLFVTLWTEAHQASLFFTISQSLLKFMSIESMMPSNHLIFCHPLLLQASIFPIIRVYSNESGGQSTGNSVSASVFPMNIQGQFLLGLTDLISLQSRGLLRVFSNTTVQKHQFLSLYFQFMKSRLYKLKQSNRVIIMPETSTFIIFFFFGG